MSKELKYRDLLIRLKDECPDHHMMNFLDSGYSPIKLRHLIKAVFEEDHTKERPVKILVVKSVDKKAIFKEQRHLFSGRAVLSNSFHDCKADDERRSVSVQINKLESIIRQNRANISSGDTPWGDTSGKKSEDLDKLTPFEAQRKLASLRVMCSKYKKKLKQLGSLPEGNPEKEKIPIIEGKLKSNEIKKEHVEIIIKNASL